jgi:antitoxin ParD1/3/4
MNVSLTAELEEYVNDKVATGLYSTASEVIREALRLLRDRDALHQTRLDELRREVLVGIEQAEQGKVAPLEAGETLKRIRKKRGTPTPKEE